MNERTGLGSADEDDLDLPRILNTVVQHQQQEADAAAAAEGISWRL